MTNETVFRALPLPQTRDGSPRRVGVEIEFGGLSEDQAARRLADALGGSVSEGGDFSRLVTGSAIGDIEVYLDTAYRKDGRALVEQGIEAARSVLPVELVTEPLTPDRLPALQDALSALRDAGATGTTDGLLLGFGVHLNVEVPSLSVEHVYPLLLTFALLEPVLRAEVPLDLSRWVQPFVSPYPSGLTDALANEAPADLTALARLYLAHTTSRNHALDALPIFREADEALILEAVGNAEAVAARPAWHYRLPDSRISEPEWQLSSVWNVWVGLEDIAEDTALRGKLCDAWREHRATLTRLPSDWVGTAKDLIAHTTLEKALSQ